jgi:methyl-accepting chemotaxis protein
VSKNNINFLLSVQTKIIFIAIAVVTLILGGYSIYEVDRRQALLNIELNDLAKVSASKLENNLRIPLWDLDSDLVAEAVEAEMLTQDISAILVFDADDSALILGRQRGITWDVLSADDGYKSFEEGEVKKEANIINNNEKIGRVEVYVSNRFKERELASSINGLLITLLLLDITIFFVLWVVMSNILRSPIAELSEAANKISRGNFNVEIDVNRKDEIGVVANSIERMKTSLSMAIERLREIDRLKKRKRLIK